MSYEGRFQFSDYGCDEPDCDIDENVTGGRRNDKNGADKNNQNSALKGLSLSSYASFLKRGPFGTNKNKKESTRVEKVQTSPSHSKNDVEIAQAALDDFVEKYTTNKSDSTYIQALLGAEYVKVAEIMEHYYDNAYQSIIESMNNVIKLMTAKTFALNLLGAVKKKDEVFDDWNYARQPIAALIALALDTHHMKMITDTKLFYVEIISEHIYDFEIKEIQSKFNLSEDAATDLVISAPSFGQDMVDAEIRHQYGAILSMLINHGKSAMEYMSAENQKELFYYIFKDEDRIAVKAVGQCLGDELIAFEEEADEALYNEYVKMLYMVLNEHDLDEIRVVLRYIVKVRAGIKKEGKDTITIFDVKKAVEYDNIKTALLDYIESSESARTFLAD